MARFIVKFLGHEQAEATRLKELRKKGAEALSVMEHSLACQDFLVGKEFTIADIALYAYTHVAHEGGFDLAAWPAVGNWLERVQSTPGYLSMSAACR